MVGKNSEHRRCWNCSRIAVIECMLCAKHKPTEPPVFCSKHCYTAHFAVHRPEGQGGVGSDLNEYCGQKHGWLGAQSYAGSSAYSVMDNPGSVEYNEEMSALKVQPYGWSLPSDFTALGAYQYRNAFGEPAILLGVCTSPRVTLPRNYWYKLYY